MHLQAAFLFAQEIGKFFALTALDLLNGITQWRYNIKVLKILAVDLEAMFFQCLSIKKIPKSRETVPLNPKRNICDFWLYILISNMFSWIFNIICYTQEGTLIEEEPRTLQCKNYIYFYMFETSGNYRLRCIRERPTVNAVLYLNIITGITRIVLSKHDSVNKDT